MTATARQEPLSGPAELEFAVLAVGLTKVFRGGKDQKVTPAVSDVSLYCRSGQVFGLLGPNGAGKTTTLRMLSTVLPPTLGTASVAGFSIIRDPEHVRQHIGFLSGNTALYPRLSVRETLHFFGSLHGLGGEALERSIDMVLDSLDMRDYADRRLETLSTGMAQKANIGRTLLHDPPVLILDEPTIGLDVLGASAMIDFIEGMKHRGKCVIFSTHILSEAERLCDQIGVLHAGRLYAIGTLDELRNRTGESYLDAVFKALVEEAVSEEARAGSPVRNWT
ncbi:MAG: ABC transporter ATP-binding protein [Planctomycetota bacterium]